MLSFGEDSLISIGESATELPYTNNGSPGANTCLFVKESSLFSLSIAKLFPSNTGVNIKQETKTRIIFILVIVFVFFLLAAQYESYLLPLAVIFSLPLGVFGAFFSTKMLGLQNNIYFQIALIMLVGLLAKNAILIVEFALQRRRSGEDLVDAAIHGAKARLRPILMTSFAFILGLMPLVLANGVLEEC